MWENLIFFPFPSTILTLGLNAGCVESAMVDKLVKQFSRRNKVLDNVLVLCFVTSKVGIENLLEGLVAVVQSSVGLEKDE
jgi:hypothetical protein